MGPLHIENNDNPVWRSNGDQLLVIMQGDLFSMCMVNFDIALDKLHFVKLLKLSINIFWEL